MNDDYWALGNTSIENAYAYLAARNYLNYDKEDILIKIINEYDVEVLIKRNSDIDINKFLDTAKRILLKNKEI